MPATHCYTPNEFINEIEQVPAEYLPQLFKIINSYRKLAAKEVAVSSFEKSWQQALSGETTPASELWEDIDNECKSLSYPQSNFSISCGSNYFNMLWYKINTG